MALLRHHVFSLEPAIGGPAARLLERLLGLAELGQLYERAPEQCEGVEFLAWALEALRVRVQVDERELAALPVSGPVVVVANHPFGAIEGLALGALAGRRRPDVRILANGLLARIPELREVFRDVDPFGGRGSVRHNAGPLRQALCSLEAGEMLVVFPAGEVAHFDLHARCVQDPPWSPTVAGLVRRARCPVVPVFVEGQNGLLFQLAGLVHPRLRTALLARELLGRRNRTVELRIGRPIPFEELAGRDDRNAIAHLRRRTEELAARHAAPVQPRRTPVSARRIIAPVPSDVLAREVDALPPERLLVDGGEQSVYAAPAREIPSLLREIGRLRETTFREAGEGTGREVDLDAFDGWYRHLFVWSRARREVVGAYRIGLTDRILAERGPEGLYTSTLFAFEPQLFAAMGPALELGRSFVRTEYQKTYAALLLLWRGIARFVLLHPRHATLYGPVSISAGYQSLSQRLIVSFLEQNRYVHDWSCWVRPRAPYEAGAEPASSHLAERRTLDDVSKLIAEIEADGKGVPILLEQYLKLGGRLLGFNVDAEFSNVLDVLVLVDLRRTDPAILARTMGRREAAGFLAYHRNAGTRAS